MPVQIVIDNNKTKRYLYCTQAYHEISPEHCFGSLREVSNALYQNLWDKRKAYCIWSAHIIVDFVQGCEPSDLDIHADEYFNSSCHDYGVCMYQSDRELDEWCQRNAIVPDEWIGQ